MAGLPDISGSTVSRANTSAWIPARVCWMTHAFLFSDLSSPGWNLVLGAHTFDVILAFAVLHHLPGAELRLAILQKARNHLAFPGGLLIHSEWQFQNSLRLSARIQPWQEIGIHENEVDEGDALLDWRAGSAVGLRYVHQFNLNELVDLAIQSRFRIAESFLSDGHEQNLSLYQVWEVLP
jgi:tRNA (uracil-5-)-methyltransferase TRM9